MTTILDFIQTLLTLELVEPGTVSLAFLGGIASAIGGVAKVAGGLLGGGSQTKTTSQGIAPMSPQELARIQSIEQELLGLQGQQKDYSQVEKRRASLRNEAAALEAQISKLPSNDGRAREQAKKLRTKLIQINNDLALDNDGLAGRYGINTVTQASGPAPGQDAQSVEMTQLFKDLLTKSIASDQAGGAAPTPEQLANATRFVDDTFTKSAQVQLDQFSRGFEEEQRARAAALGRDPNMDMQTQAAIGTRLADLNAQLGAERGSQIAGRLEQTQQRGLQSAMQGSAFFNDLANRAYQNRMGLINARSGIADIFQRDRGANVTQRQTTPGADRGLLGDIGSIAGGIRETANLGKSIGGGLSDFFSRGGSSNVTQGASGRDLASGRQVM